MQCESISEQHNVSQLVDQDMVAPPRHIGMFSEPVYVSGDWPELMKETLNETMLPRFTEDEKKLIKGA